MRGRLLTMATEIVPYHMAHNAEAEGCDLLMEIERLDLLQDFVDESAYQRVCLYLTRYIYTQSTGRWFKHCCEAGLLYL